MPATALPVIFAPCADAGPEITNMPGRRICRSQHIRFKGNPLRDVSAEFCAGGPGNCPYRNTEEMPLLRRPPTRVKPSRDPNADRLTRIEIPCLSERENFVREWCALGIDARHIRDCLCDEAMVGYEHCARNHPSPRPDVRNCSACNHYTLPSVDGPRHLLYHLMPTRNGMWQRNLDQLKPRLPLFDGRRVIAVVTGKDAGGVDLEHPDKVREYLAGERVDDWIIAPNDPTLREVVTWRSLWERVAHLAGFTFYAQAKGVTRPVNPGVSVHRWADLLYKVNLDYWPLMSALLSKHEVSGTFKKVGAGFIGSRSTWHFSGSFWWTANAALGDKWKDIERAWWANEAWVGLHWRPEQAGCLFHEGVVPTLDMYKLSYVEKLEREFETWKSLHERFRTDIL